MTILSSFLWGTKFVLSDPKLQLYTTYQVCHAHTHTKLQCTGTEFTVLVVLKLKYLSRIMNGWECHWYICHYSCHCLGKTWMVGTAISNSATSDFYKSSLEERYWEEGIKESTFCHCLGCALLCKPQMSLIYTFMRPHILHVFSGGDSLALNENPHKWAGSKWPRWLWSKWPSPQGRREVSPNARATFL